VNGDGPPLAAFLAEANLPPMARSEVIPHAEATGRSPSAGGLLLRRTLSVRDDQVEQFAGLLSG
jgi:hypothetical protein